MTASLLAALVGLAGSRGAREPGSRAPRVRWAALSGLLAGLAFLTKAPAVVLFGLVPLLAVVLSWRTWRASSSARRAPRLTHLRPAAPLAGRLGGLRRRDLPAALAGRLG
jgi:hypothetical protein